MKCLTHADENGTIRLELLGWTGALFIGFFIGSGGGCEWKEIKGLEGSRSAT